MIDPGECELDRRAGGPLDQVFASLRQSFPDLSVRRLAVTHAGDDDNVWFVRRLSGATELQVDSMPNGAPPFLLESDVDRARTSDVAEAVEFMTSRLRQ